MPSKCRGNQRQIEFCFKKSPGDNALVLNVVGIPMVTSTTFRKLAACKEKQLKLNKTEKTPHSQTLSRDELIEKRLMEGIKKMCESGVSALKPADVINIESLMFVDHVISEDGEDKRSKTALDDILASLQTAIDICFKAADVSGSSDSKDSDYIQQCGQVTWR